MKIRYFLKDVEPLLKRTAYTFSKDYCLSWSRMKPFSDFETDCRAFDTLSEMNEHFKGQIWFRYNGTEAWKIVHIGSTECPKDELKIPYVKVKEFITLICLSNNQLRTVLLETFSKKWTN